MFTLLAAVCYFLVAIMAVANVGAAVLCLRSGRPIAWVPLIASVSGAVVVFGLSRVAPVFGISVVVLPLVLLTQWGWVRGRRNRAAVAS
jgi:hypothetical protein